MSEGHVLRSDDDEGNTSDADLLRIVAPRPKSPAAEPITSTWDGLSYLAYALFGLAIITSGMGMEYPMSWVCQESDSTSQWCSLEKNPVTLCNCLIDGIKYRVGSQPLQFISKVSSLLAIWIPLHFAVQHAFKCLPRIDHYEDHRVLRNWPVLMCGFGCCTLTFYMGCFQLQVLLNLGSNQKDVASIILRILSTLVLWSCCIMEARILSLVIFAQGRPPPGRTLRVIQSFLLFRVIWWNLVVILDSNKYLCMFKCADSSVSIFTATLTFPCPMMFYMLSSYHLNCWQKQTPLPQLGRHMLNLPSGYASKSLFFTLLLLAIGLLGLEWVSYTKLRDFEVAQTGEGIILLILLIWCTYSIIINAKHGKFHPTLTIKMLIIMASMHASVGIMKLYFEWFVKNYQPSSAISRVSVISSQAIGTLFTLSQTIVLSFRKGSGLPASDNLVRTLLIVNSVWMAFAYYSYGHHLDYILNVCLNTM